MLNLHAEDPMCRAPAGHLEARSKCHLQSVQRGSVVGEQEHVVDIESDDDEDAVPVPGEDGVIGVAANKPGGFKLSSDHLVPLPAGLLEAI